MAKFVFVLTTGTENPSKGVRGMQLAAAAAEEGHHVTLFLTDDAVIYAKKGMIDNIVSPTGDDMNTHVEKLTRANVPFLVCTPCAKARQLDEQDLVEGGRFGTARELLAIAADSVVFNF